MFKKKNIRSTDLIKPLFLFFWFFIISPVAWAQTFNCDIDLSEGAPAPILPQIICPFVRIINLGILVAGVALVIFIVIGAIKLAVSVGDPKGMQAAQKTWTFALIGFFVIVGAFFIFGALGSALGISNVLNANIAENFATMIFDRIAGFTRMFGVTYVD